MAYHLLAMSIHAAPKILQAVFSGGWLGVDIFFVLSGFLITEILLRTRRSERYFSRFYIRRIARIFPLYYVLLIVFFLLRLNIPYLPCLTFTVNWLHNAAFQNRVGNLWSLAIEEQFYIVWPAAVLLIPPKYLPRICLTLTASSVITRYFLAWSGHADFAHSLPFSRMDGLSLGAFLATVKWRASSRAVGAVVAACLFGLLLILGLRHTLDTSAWQALTLAPLLVAIASGAVLLFVGSPGYHGVFTNRVMVWFGQRSYGLYLLHQQLYGQIEHYLLRFPLGPITVPLVGWGVACGLAELSWRGLESPFLRRTVSESVPSSMTRIASIGHTVVETRKSQADLTDRSPAQGP